MISHSRLTMDDAGYVRHVRALLAETQAEFAKRLGRSIRTVSAYETGEEPVSRKSMLEIERLESDFKRGRHGRRKA